MTDEQTKQALAIVQTVAELDGDVGICVFCDGTETREHEPECTYVAACKLIEQVGSDE